MDLIRGLKIHFAKQRVLDFLFQKLEGLKNYYVKHRIPDNY